MENIGEVINRALNNGDLHNDLPGDYIGEDGLLYCGKCRTPKQTRLKAEFREFFNNAEVIPFMCKCEAEKCEREDREHKERQAALELRARYSEWLSKCFVNTAYRELTFESDKGYDPELIDTARDFVERFDHYKSLRSGLLFSGSVGTGKTFAAVCIANALLKRGIGVVFRTESELLHEACSDKNERLRSCLKNAELFILDDFGACLKSEKQAAAIFPYIDDWSASKKPLIVTTNLKLAEFKETEDVDKARIFSRVIESCSIPVIANGRDVRRVISREKYGEFKAGGQFSAQILR